MIYIHMHTHQEAGLTQVLGVVGLQMVARCAKRMSRQSILSSLVDPYSMNKVQQQPCCVKKKAETPCQDHARHHQFQINSLQLDFFAGAGIQTEAATKALVCPQSHP